MIGAHRPNLMDVAKPVTFIKQNTSLILQWRPRMRVASEYMRGETKKRHICTDICAVTLPDAPLTSESAH